MSPLSALLVTLVLNPSHPSSYLLLTFVWLLYWLIYKICLPIKHLLSSDLLPLNDPDHHTLLHLRTENRSSNLFLVSSPMAFKCTWQTLSDLGSDHLPIAIPALSLINSLSCSPSFDYNKVRWDKYLSYIDTHCPPPSSITALSLSEATYTFTKLLNDAAASAIPFGNINRSAKAWWSPEIADVVAKPRKAFEGHSVLKKNARTILLYRDIPQLWFLRLKLSHGSKLALPFRKNRPSKVFSLLHSISGSSSSSSNLPNFPSCHTPVDCTNQLSAHLLSHFSTQTPKTLSKYWKNTHE